MPILSRIKALFRIISKKISSEVSADKNFILQFLKNSFLRPLLLALLLSMVCRFPYFQELSMNWDESTFIICGQAVLDGILPYTTVWDIKPPLMFYFFALIIAFTGKSIIGVHIAGALIVAGISMAVFCIVKREFNGFLAYTSMVLTITMLSFMPDGQPLLSEHLSLLPLMWSMYFIMGNQSYRSYFLAGVLMGCATMIRMNQAYVGVFIGASILLLLIKPKFTINELWKPIYFGLGIILAISLVSLPHLLAGEVDLLIESLILASWAYAGNGSDVVGIWQGLKKIIWQICSGNTWNFYIDRKMLSILSSVFFIGFALGVLRSILFFKSHDHRRYLVIALAGILGMLYSILTGGNFFYHYLLQLIPLFSLMLPFLFGKFQFHKTVEWLLGLSFVTFLSIALYNPMTKRNGIYKKQSERIIFTSDYLNEHMAEQDKLFCLNDHLIYWFTNRHPIANTVTHPSIINKDYFFPYIPDASRNSESEMQQILNKKPEWIVRKSEDWLKPAAQSLLNDQIRHHYNLKMEHSGLELYQLVVDSN